MPADTAVLETPTATAPAAAPTPAPASPAPAATTPAPAPAAAPAPADKGTPKPAATSLLDDLDDDDGDVAAAPATEAAPAEGENAEAQDKTTEKPQTGDFPDDWRERFIKAQGYADKKDAKGRPIADKVMQQLKRFKSPFAAFEALISAQEKIRSGDLKAALPEDATPEEQAAWREANGLPPEPTKYDIPAVPGNKWTEADAPVLDGFKEVAFKNNLPQSAVNEIVSFYANLRNQQVEHINERLHEIDVTSREAAQDALRAELGGDYKPAMTLARRFLEDNKFVRGELGQQIMQARLPTGERLANNPDFLRMIIDVARNEYGEGAMVSSNEQAQVNNREAELVSIMNSDIHRYNNERNAKGETLAEELFRLRSEKAARMGGRR